MQPIGNSSTDLANLLGGIAKCGARAPLNIVSWKSMPDTNLDLMWRDVQRSGEKTLTPPSDSRVNPEQWPDLVNYWQHDDVQAQSLKNSNNLRKNLEFLPRIRDYDEDVF
ncbi:hypothetical protein Tco_1203861 [Tanacetum coccineum]